MANEEMRRIQLALEQVQQPQVVAAAGATEAPAPAQQAGGDTYSLTVANRAICVSTTKASLRAQYL